MKILGIAIARTLLLNVVLILCGVVFYSSSSLLLPPLLFILMITYANRYIDWKKQEGSRNPYALLNPQKKNIRHGIEAFVIVNIISLLATLAQMAFQGYLESITDGWSEIPDYQPTLSDWGLAVLVLEGLILALYLFNESQRWYSNKNSDNKTQLYKNTSSHREAQLYQKLLQKSQGDREQVERLIDYERRRSPNSCRADLLQSAITRWERDLR